MPATKAQADRRVSVVLFDGFELLDVFGPVELLFLVPSVRVEYVGPVRGPVTSSQGAQVVAELSYDELLDPDILLVPGGIGTRKLVQDKEFRGWLQDSGDRAERVTSVCTGSALLAAAGLLDGYRATSNKAAFDWATSNGAGVEWVGAARWVHDRDRWTSSGVAAGMDMTAALIADLYDESVARRACELAEYNPHIDSTWDPFAAIHGIS